MKTFERPHRFIVLLLPLAIGCVHTYDIDSRGGDGPAVRLTGDATIYVSQPEDGRYGVQIYSGSGAMTTQALAVALSLYAKKVEAADSHASLEADLEATRTRNLRYLISPTILHWEERATEWSGKSDRITVKLELVDADSGEVVDTTLVSGKSKWATFGGDHPQELLPEPLGKYAKALFAVGARSPTMRILSAISEFESGRSGAAARMRSVELNQ